MHLLPTLFNAAYEVALLYKSSAHVWAFCTRSPLRLCFCRRHLIQRGCRQRQRQVPNRVSLRHLPVQDGSPRLGASEHAKSPISISCESDPSGSSTILCGLLLLCSEVFEVSFGDTQDGKLLQDNSVGLCGLNKSSRHPRNPMAVRKFY